MKKQIEHKEKEICKLCDKEIDTTFDDWAILVDYEAAEQIKIGFYHRKCFSDLITAQGKIIQQKFEERLRNFTQRILGNVKLPTIE